MRILLPVHIYLPAHRAGVETYTDQLARHLSRGAEVRVATTEKVISRPSGRIRHRAVGGIPVYEVVNNLDFAAYDETWANPVMEEAFARILDDFRPDVVHFQHLMYWSWGLPALARRAGAATLATLHDYWLVCARRGQLVDWQGRLCAAPEPERCARCTARSDWRQPDEARRWIRRLTALRSATGVALDEPMRWMQKVRSRVRPPAGGAVAAVPGDGSGPDPAPWREAYDRRSAAMRRLAADLDLTVTPSTTLRDVVVGAGFPAEGIRIVRQGLDPAPFADVRRRPGDGTLRLGFVGTVAPHKGLHVVVDAVRRLPPDRVSLSVWGPSGQHEEYARSVREAAADAPHVRFLGALTKERVPSAYEEIDVSVVPSLWNECCPLTIQESMLAGVPAVVSGFGGMAELVRDGVDGLHAVAGDVDSWEAALRRLVDEPGLVHRLRQGIGPVPTMQEHAGELRSLYDEILGHGAGRPAGGGRQA